MSTQRQPKTPTVKGPEEWFTGDVYFNAYYSGQQPSRARLNLVRFAPGAHTAWHKHAVGQTLHVTEGIGYVQSRGEELSPADGAHNGRLGCVGCARRNPGKQHARNHVRHFRLVHSVDLPGCGCFAVGPGSANSSSCVAAQEAKSCKASAVGEPAGAVYTFSTRPGSLGSSMDW